MEEFFEERKLPIPKSIKSIKSAYVSPKNSIADFVYSKHMSQAV